MAIDRKQLIELLVARTGLEEDKVEEQLSRLTDHIKHAAEEGKSFQIEGLGTFNLDDDTLRFSPSETLETEINYRYAGMKPIELIGAFKETPPAVGDDEEPAEEEAGTTEPAEEPAEEPVHTGPEPEPETDLELDQEPEERTISEPDKSLQDELKEVLGGEKTAGSRGSVNAPDLGEELLPAVDTEGIGEEEKPKASFVFDAEGAEEEQRPEQKNPSATRKAAKEKKAKDPIGTVLTVCVAVLAIGVAGWLVYDLGFLSAQGPDQQAGNQQAQVVQPASGQAAGNVSLENEASPDVSEQEPDNRVTGSDTDSPAEISDYGLMGRASTGGNNGYTIVIHSLANKNTSQAIKDRLELEGYRTTLTSAVVNGNVFWRVGLGQFRTVADAQKAVHSLPEQYQEDHFIKRIQ